MMIAHSTVCRIMAQPNCTQSIETSWSYLIGQQDRSPRLFLLLESRIVVLRIGT